MNAPFMRWPWPSSRSQGQGVRETTASGKVNPAHAGTHLPRQAGRPPGGPQPPPARTPVIQHTIWHASSLGQRPELSHKEECRKRSTPSSFRELRHALHACAGRALHPTRQRRRHESSPQPAAAAAAATPAAAADEAACLLHASCRICACAGRHRGGGAPGSMDALTRAAAV